MLYIHVYTHVYVHVCTCVYMYVYMCIYNKIWGFPGGSDGKESTYNAKNPPTMQEIQVPPLSQKDPLEKGKATHCSILA